ncbi:MAG: hypothetical protein J7L82_00925 [Staphylothermus sp.]|nr:hypothetical protein [Staphylothermus sp.]
MVERVVFVDRIRVWLQVDKGYRYRRVLIVVPRELHDLLDMNKRYKVVLEPLEDS